MTESEKIKLIIDYSKMSRRALGIELGYKDGSFLFHVLKGRNGISRNLARKITDLFPEISYNWLLKDEGEMLKEPNSKSIKELMEKIEFLESHLRGQDARIKILEEKINLNSNLK
jgi:hypothetical protein